MKLFAAAKTELLRSNADQKHPFRFFSLATLGKYPEVRTVVKRNIAADLSIVFFSDSRAPKIQQIKENNHVSALFYHPKKKLQVRMRGEALLIDRTHQDFSTYFNQIQQARSLQDYTTALPPGKRINELSALNHVEEIHFVPVRIYPQEIDVLQLDLQGHQRALYTHDKDEWREILITP